MSESRRWSLSRLLPCLLLLGLSGCATQPYHAPPKDQSELTDAGFYEGMEDSFTSPLEQGSFFAVYDPWGPVNRRVYLFNTYLDSYVLLPAVRLYRFAVPALARQGVTNFLANLNEVTTFVNLVLQLEGEKAMSSAARFLTNSTVGIVGLFDVASHIDLPTYNEDLGQTLGRYEMTSGPYVVLPLFGPSSARDTLGLAGDFWTSREINVFGVRKAIWASLPLTVLEVIQTRDNLPFSYGDLSSPFEYEVVRYLYLESREFKSRE